MQFPVALPPAAAPLDQTDEIHELAAITPSKRVMERTLPPVVRRRPSRRREEAPQHRPAVPAAEQRVLEDRRKYCRRVENRWVLLDTRSRTDRRRNNRREGDHASTIAVKA